MPFRFRPSGLMVLDRDYITASYTTTAAVPFTSATRNMSRYDINGNPLPPEPIPQSTREPPRDVAAPWWLDPAKYQRAMETE